LMCMHDRIDVGTGGVKRRVNHRLTRRVLEFGDGALVAGFSVILLADVHIRINIHRDNMLGRDFAQRREHRLDKKASRSRNARADMTVIIGQALVKHDAISQGNLFFELFEVFLADFHLAPLSGCYYDARRAGSLAPTG
jgi:hypothetical protein